MRAILAAEELEGRIVPTLLGQQLFPLDNPWNQNIANAPLAANSSAVIAHIGTSVTLHPDWGADSAANGNSPLYGIPINIVHGDGMPTVNVTIDNYPGESDSQPVPIPTNAVIEGDYQDGPNLNGPGYGENGNLNQRGDSHLIIWDEDTNTAYELYGVSRPSDPNLFPNTSDVELPNPGGWHAAQETVWNMNTNSFRTLGDTSADAAGLSILAGLARPDEGLPVTLGGQGAITHALRVTLPSDDINPQYIYPASHMVNESQGADNLPMGGRLRLANTPAIDALIEAMPPESQILARAMQQYGLIVADIGSAMYVTGTSATLDTVDSPNTDLTWNLDDIFASNGLEVLTAGDFQVVNLTPIVTGLSQTTSSAGSTITISGQNFSGAAGNLSVFFGSTPATSVTVVSDTQITAVVPMGTGTVNVTVQSGIQETDNVSDNPNANVNAPIFGYGTSSITAADQFTYETLAITSANATTFVAGTFGTFTVTATGLEPPSLSETGSLPAGITFNAATGILSGTATVSGAFTVTFTAADGIEAPVNQSFTLNVDQAPAITSTPTATFTAGSSNTLTLTATGFPAPTFSETGTLPAGVTLTSAGLLSGDPAPSAGGVYPLVITASNGVGSAATQNFALTVNVPTTTALSDNGLNPSVTGQSVTFTATVSSGSGGTPTGSVAFFDGSTELGAGSALSGTGSSATSTFTLSTLPLGANAIQALYTASGFFLSSSQSLTQTVEIGTSTTVASTLNPSTYGQAVTLTATVTNTSGSGGPPTGTIEFFDGTTDLGAGSTLTGNGTTASSTFTLSTLSGGKHPLRAVYTATGYFENGSASLTQVVNPASQTITFNPLNPVVLGVSPITTPNRHGVLWVACDLPCAFRARHSQRQRPYRDQRGEHRYRCQPGWQCQLQRRLDRPADACRQPSDSTVLGQFQSACQSLPRCGLERGRRHYCRLEQPGCGYRCSGPGYGRRPQRSQCRPSGHRQPVCGRPVCRTGGSLHWHWRPELLPRGRGHHRHRLRGLPVSQHQRRVHSVAGTKPLTGSANGILVFEVIGPSLKLFLGSNLIAYADDTTLTNGNIGIRFTQGVTIASFSASALAPGTPGLPFTSDFTTVTSPEPNQLTNNWINQDGNYTVNTTSGTATGKVSLDLATLVGVTATNVGVQATISVASGQYAGLVADYSGSGDQNYYLGGVVATATGYEAYLYRNISGVFTPLFTQNYTGSANGVLRFEVYDSSLKLFLGTSLIAYGDDATLTGGSVGMRVTAGAAVSGFSASVLSAGTPSLPFTSDFTTVTSPEPNQLTDNRINQVGNYHVNTTAGTSTGIANLELATLNLTVANVTVQAQVTVTGTGQYAALVSRYTGSGDQNYYLGGLDNTGSGVLAYLYKNVNGVFTLLQSQMVSATSGTLLLVTSGTSLSLTYNGVLLFAVADFSLPASGSVGMRTTAGATVSNFSASVPNSGLPFSDTFNGSQLEQSQLADPGGFLYGRQQHGHRCEQPGPGHAARRQRSQCGGPGHHLRGERTIRWSGGRLLGQRGRELSPGWRRGHDDGL